MAARRKKAGGKKGGKKARTPAKKGRADQTRVTGRSIVRWWPVAALIAVVAGVVAWQSHPAGRTVPEALRVHVLATHPHDRGAFTQGLLFHDGALYESTGLRGQSTVREVDLETGEVRRKAELPDALFGEGLARVDDELFQLTWQSGKALVWSLGGFDKQREHDYRGEGWGLCYDGERLVMSDGTAWLTFRDPRTFQRVGEVRVTRAGRPLRKLNELECVDGVVYANVWTDDHIARIDPETGDVTGWIDASGLLDDADRDGTEDVLNGIAYLPDSGHFAITGKRWPTLFEVEFVPM